MHADLHGLRPAFCRRVQLLTAYCRHVEVFISRVNCKVVGGRQAYTAAWCWRWWLMYRAALVAVNAVNAWTNGAWATAPALTTEYIEIKTATNCVSSSVSDVIVGQCGSGTTGTRTYSLRSDVSFLASEVGNEQMEWGIMGLCQLWPLCASLALPSGPVSNV